MWVDPVADPGIAVGHELYEYSVIRCVPAVENEAVKASRVFWDGVGVRDRGNSRFDHQQVSRGGQENHL